MPRRKNLDCQRCAADSIEVAKAKPCWDTENPKTCRSKRAYYKKHSVNKAKKRSKHRSDRVERVKELDIPLFGLQATPEVLMTFYRDRADGPIHADLRSASWMTGRRWLALRRFISRACLSLSSVSILKMCSAYSMLSLGRSCP